MPIRHIFVYGTLMKDMENYDLICDCAGPMLPGELRGYLYHLDAFGFPAIILDPTGPVIRGEIVEISDMARMLPLLDGLEDYHCPGHPDNMYEREERLALTPGGEQVAVYVYTWSRPETLSEIGTLVENGCWRDFVKCTGEE